MPKIIDHLERRQEVAEATWNVIKRVGIEATTLRMIAADMNVTTGTLGHYFRNKDQLIEFAFRSIIEEALAEIERETALLEPGLARLRFAIQAMMPSHFDRPGEGRAVASATLSYWGFAASQTPLAAAHRAHYGDWRRLLDNFLQESVTRGEIGNLDLELEVAMIIATIDGTVVGNVLEPDRFDAPCLERIADAMIDRLKVKP